MQTLDFFGLLFHFGRGFDLIRGRFDRVDQTTMQYTAAVTDPKTWTRPWTVSLPLKLHPEYQFFEYACHEGNHAMSNILSGSRADEKR